MQARRCLVVGAVRHPAAVTKLSEPPFECIEGQMPCIGNMNTILRLGYFAY